MSRTSRGHAIGAGAASAPDAPYHHERRHPADAMTHGPPPDKEIRHEKERNDDQVDHETFQARN